MYEKKGIIAPRRRVRMPTTTRTFRVFVSSTFEDLKEERNALQREVFPELAKLCEVHGARFQAIDLRWGVREEASLDQKTMEICMAEIERCQQTKIKPNFIILLGDRYGWRPLPARISAEEFERVRDAISDGKARELIGTWYQRDDNAVPPEYLLKPRTGEFVDRKRWRECEQSLHENLGKAARAAALAGEDLIKYEASATHQEILKGLGKSPEDRRHVFAFFRHEAESEDLDLHELKRTLRDQLGDNAFSFDAGDYSELCKCVKKSLGRIILSEAERFESRSALDLEVEAHKVFAEDRSKDFVGREAVLDAINDYLKDADQRPLVIHGASGSGKSAIMARASGVEGAIRRFIGATPESSSGPTLLRSLCLQFARRYGQPEDAPATFNELAVAFSDRIKLATAERPLILYLDGLDQLGPQDPAAATNWLPADLPQNCKVIVSTIEVPAALGKARLHKVEAFPVEDAGEALRGWLDKAHRTVQSQQRAKLLSSFCRSPLPLYLKLAFEEARRWRSFDPLDQCVLGEGLAGIVDRLFSRLSEESSHGKVLVSHALGYLTAARYGLTEDELLAVLAADEEMWNDFSSRAKHEPPERRLPVIVWSRLYLDLEPYLTERAAPGGAVISFYHGQLAERVAVSSSHHSELAKYFAAQPLWLGTSRPNERKVTEFVRQQVKGGLPEDCVATLTDLKFIEAKCAAELVFDLQEDYRLVIAAVPEVRPELQEENRRKAELARWTAILIECARERRAPKPEEVIQSIKPWTDEQIAEECRRIVENPTRLDRLKAFSRFAEQECYPLIEHGKHSGFTLQHAFNHAPSGPVREEATPATESSTVPMLLQEWPKNVRYNPKPALLRTLKGHSDSVWSVSIAANGRRAVSAGQDGTLRVWDLESGQSLWVLKGHPYWVNCVSVVGAAPGRDRPAANGAAAVVPARSCGGTRGVRF
jgi:hypothetical protein